MVSKFTNDISKLSFIDSRVFRSLPNDRVPAVAQLQLQTISSTAPRNRQQQSSRSVLIIRITLPTVIIQFHMLHKFTMMRSNKRPLGMMANATWDTPLQAAPSAKRAKDQRQRRVESFKSLPSPEKSSNKNTFKSDKGIDRLLSLLRTPSFVGQPSREHDLTIPRAIVCNIGVVKKKRSLDERIKKLSVSDSMTSMASSLSSCSAFTSAVDVPAKPGAACDISIQPAKRLRKSLTIENSEMPRVHSCQTA